MQKISEDFKFGEFQSIKRAHSNASSTMDVDAIINAIDSDSDDDAALDEMIARFSINVSKTSAERELEQKYAYIGTVVGTIIFINIKLQY